MAAALLRRAPTMASLASQSTTTVPSSLARSASTASYRPACGRSTTVPILRSLSLSITSTTSEYATIKQETTDSDSRYSLTDGESRCGYLAQGCKVHLTCISSCTADAWTGDDSSKGVGKSGDCPMVLLGLEGFSLCISAPVSSVLPLLLVHSSCGEDGSIIAKQLNRLRFHHDQLHHARHSQGNNIPTVSPDSADATLNTFTICPTRPALVYKV